MKAPSNLDGYRAAALNVAEHLEMERRHLPSRLKKGFKRTAAYRQGYYDGLLFANCMNAMGEFPSSNAEPIQTALAKLKQSFTQNPA